MNERPFVYLVCYEFFLVKFVRAHMQMHCSRLTFVGQVDLQFSAEKRFVPRSPPSFACNVELVHIPTTLDRLPTTELGRREPNVTIDIDLTIYRLSAVSDERISRISRTDAADTLLYYQGWRIRHGSMCHLRNRMLPRCTTAVHPALLKS